MFRPLLLTLLIACSFSSIATTLNCGGYNVEFIPEAMTKINGQAVTSQKIKFLGEDGIKMDMGLMPARDGNNYGFQYIRYPGTEKRFLNVQLLQNGHNAPRIIGSFPCKKVAD